MLPRQSWFSGAGRLAAQAVQPRRRRGCREESKVAPAERDGSAVVQLPTPSRWSISCRITVIAL
jgi:hypothetical protein